MSKQISAYKFAILGGGISGLAAAYRLLDKVKDPSNIAVLESSDRVGGWLQSCTTEHGAVFELGPRSIRPVGNAGMATLKIVGTILYRVKFPHSAMHLLCLQRISNYFS